MQSHTKDNKCHPIHHLHLSTVCVQLFGEHEIALDPKKSDPHWKLHFIWWLLWHHKNLTVFLVYMRSTRLMGCLR